MIVVGGTYFERCAFPEWDALYGSGLRAAIQLASLGSKVAFHTFASPFTQRRIPYISHLFGIEITSYLNSETYVFDYVHSLTTPNWDVKYDNSVKDFAHIEASGECLLIYGMMEGLAKVKVSARRAVYDPQSSNTRFREYGSTAEDLALVLNASEAKTWGGEPTLAACAAQIAKMENASVLVIKNGPYGALVWDRATGLHEIPAYNVGRVFKIGSGDIFSAIFTFLWGRENRTAVDAARIASQATAHYVATRQFIRNLSEIPALEPIRVSRSNLTMYLAGPFFTLGDRWLVNDLRDIFDSFGISVISPIHDFGVGPDKEIVQADLKAIEESDVVFAVVSGGDPGTLFEVGYARKI